MRVTLVISSMQGGGAERIMSVLANAWAGREWPVTLITWAGPDEPVRYPLAPLVNYRPLGVASMKRNRLFTPRNITRLWTLRRAIRSSEPDVVISFLDKVNVTVLLACLGLRRPVIVAEHTDPHYQKIGFFWGFLRRLLYGRAAGLVLLTAQARDFFGGRARARSTIIPNPVKVEGGGIPPLAKCLPKPCLLAMGRLSEEKGHDLLIRAFARLCARHSTWRLFIIGEGPLRESLCRLIRSLGLAEKVLLTGWVDRPAAMLRQGDAFVLSSRHEGFPGALAEAMACGLPVVATACSGAMAIVRDGVDGILVPPEDVDALAVAMDRLMSDEAERRRLGERAVEITERFGLEKVMALWDRLLEEVVHDGTGLRGLDQRKGAR